MLVRLTLSFLLLGPSSLFVSLHAVEMGSVIRQGDARNAYNIRREVAWLDLVGVGKELVQTALL